MGRCLCLINKRNSPPIWLTFPYLLPCTKLILEIILFSFHCRVIRQQWVFFFFTSVRFAHVLALFVMWLCYFLCDFTRPLFIPTSHSRISLSTHQLNSNAWLRLSDEQLVLNVQVSYFPVKPFWKRVNLIENTRFAKEYDDIIVSKNVIFEIPYSHSTKSNKPHMIALWLNGAYIEWLYFVNP